MNMFYMLKHNLFIEHNIFRQTSTMWASQWPEVGVAPKRVCVCVWYNLDLDLWPWIRSRSMATNQI